MTLSQKIRVVGKFPAALHELTVSMNSSPYLVATNGSGPRDKSRRRHYIIICVMKFTVVTKLNTNKFIMRVGRDDAH